MPRKKLTPPTIEVLPALAVPRPEGIERAAQVARMAAQFAALADQPTAQRAADFRTLARMRIKAVRQHYQRVTKPFREALREVQRQQAEELAPWLAADRTVGAAILAWMEAERLRVEAEAQDRLQAALEAAQARQRAQAEALTRAAAAAPTRASRRDLARQAREVAAAPAIPVLDGPAPRVEKLGGTHTQERWSAHVWDREALVAGVVAGEVPPAAVEPDQDWLDGQAQQARQDLDLPGVRAVRATSLVSRGRA